MTERLPNFESFKTNIVENINDLELKYLDLSKIAVKYSSELEEQKKLFLIIKSLVLEKDKIIK